MKHPPTETANSRRRRVIIDTRLQGRLVLRVAAFWAVYHVVLWHAMFLHRYIQYRGELAAGARPMPFSQLYTEFVNAHTSMLLCAFLVLPILLWETLKQTHRIAGPAERIRRMIRRLAAGYQVEPLRLRADDLLDDLVLDLNELLAVQQAKEIQQARGAGSGQVPLPPELPPKPPASGGREVDRQTTAAAEADSIGTSGDRVTDHDIDPEASAIMEEIHDLQRSAARPLTEQERQELELYRQQVQ
ncbi:MAG: hypothetical protein KDA79_09755 [Planctomycetaceae bacterium]|nr:hypothetical protein [Planctomycetaceae bacterium]